MATIMTGYDRTGAMLILEPRERLIYPFNIGDYSEVRFGLYWSWTSAHSGDNVPPPTETISSTTPLLTPFIGLCNYNTGTLGFPGQSNGFDYVGWYGGTASLEFQGGTTLNYNWGNGSFGRGQFAFVSDQTGWAINGNSYFTFSLFNTTAFGVPISTCSDVTCGNKFLSRILFPTATQVGLQGSSASSPTSDTSVQNLRAQLATFGNPYPTQIMYFPWASGGSGSPHPLMRPNALFIYNPPLNARMRIHAIAVERYA